MAIVRGGSKAQKTRLALGWLEAWLRFQRACDVLGAVVFDIDDTLVYDDGPQKKERTVVATRRVYQVCQALGYTCAIVRTSRRCHKPQRNPSYAAQNRCDSLGIFVHDAIFDKIDIDRHICVQTRRAKRHCASTPHRRQYWRHVARRAAVPGRLAHVRKRRHARRDVRRLLSAAQSRRGRRQIAC